MLWLMSDEDIRRFYAFVPVLFWPVLWWNLYRLQRWAEGQEGLGPLAVNCTKYGYVYIRYRVPPRDDWRQACATAGQEHWEWGCLEPVPDYAGFLRLIAPKRVRPRSAPWAELCPAPIPADTS